MLLHLTSPTYSDFKVNMNAPLSYIARFSVIEWTLVAMLLLFFLFQLFFYLFIYRKPYVYEKKRKEHPVPDTDLPGISVIITSKDNGEELEKNLPFIMEQDYPNFEVVVVNQGSSDNTDMVLIAAKQKYPQLYHTFIPAGTDEVNEKKLALTLGIKAAKYDILLFTEAYCKPSTTKWIREYGKEFALGRDIVLGYCKLLMNNKICMRNFIQYDNLMHHLKFLSMAIAHKPFMGIGRNMAYRKELFLKNKGFSSVLGVNGGEDDLYLNKIARKQNTGVVVSGESMTETDGVKSFSTWKTLKSKYKYTQQFYKGFSARLFRWERFSKRAFYVVWLISIALSIADSNYILLGFALFLFLFRFGTQLVVINKNSRLFNAGKYHLNLLFFDLF